VVREDLPRGSFELPEEEEEHGEAPANAESDGGEAEREALGRFHAARAKGARCPGRA